MEIPFDDFKTFILMYRLGGQLFQNECCGVGGKLFTCPYPLKVQACPPLFYTLSSNLITSYYIIKIRYKGLAICFINKVLEINIIITLFQFICRSVWCVVCVMCVCVWRERERA